jgi:hypothetical protein
MAGPASAKMSAKHKAQITKQLRKAVKKNPKVVGKRWFLKKATLVSFKLPITVRLRTGDVPATPANEAATANTNRATLDLGASLGQREVNLGGSLSGEITFKDSFDGGALGNVDLDLNPGNKSLTSTSIPLLWNTQVSQVGTRFDANFLGLPAAASGCGNWSGASLPFGAGLGAGPAPVGGIPQPGGLPGFPFHVSTDPLIGSAGAPEGYLPINPGVDDINAVVPSRDPANPLSLGGNIDPFPQSALFDPLASPTPPSVKDTVLRTAPLSLGIAQAGLEVNQDAVLNGVSGSQNIVIGKSGGQANLFGNIPGKPYGIDVTVSLATKINSIFRIVDQDVFGTNLRHGDPWPAGIFNCRQVYSGAVQNYIPDVRLKGNLKISPGITSDGKLRIAKATLSSSDPSRFAVSACLVPYASFDLPQNSSDTFPNPSKIPVPTGGLATVGSLPVDTNTVRPVPTSAGCNADPTGLVKESALSPSTVNALAPAVPANGYTTNASGSAVSVAADLNVNNVVADILIGDTP